MKGGKQESSACGCLLLAVGRWFWTKCSEMYSEIQPVAKTKCLTFRIYYLVTEPLLLRYKKNLLFKPVESPSHYFHKIDYLQNLTFPFARHAFVCICSLLLCRYVLLGHERRQRLAS